MIPVGRLLRTRGRSGEFIAELYNTDPERAESFREFTLSLGDRQLTARVEQLWYHDGRPVFKLSGIDSISDAEPWEGAELLVPDDQRLRPPEGEYVYADLIGCRIEFGGEVLGVVAGIEEYGGPALLRVTAPDGREMLIPFARSICREIDVFNKIIRADLPEGLSDL